MLSPPQILSQYSLDYLLAHSPPDSPPSEHPDATASTGVNTMTSEWQSSQQSAGDLDVFGEHDASTLTLGYGETADLHVLHSSPPESGRFADVINNFISRGLEQQPQTGEGVGAAVRYFRGVAVAMEGRHNFSPEQAAKVHDLMINGWQKHVAEVIGRTLRSSDRLLAVLDDIINEAGLSGAVEPPAITKLALHNALANIDGFVPPTPHSQAEVDLKPQPSHTSKHIHQGMGEAGDLKTQPSPGMSEQQGLARVGDLKPHPSRFKNFDQQDTEAADGDAKAPDVICPITAEPSEPNTVQKTSAKPRFSSTSRFFKHHAVKAKKAARTGAWSSEERDRAKQVADGEWSRMDMRTQAEWEDLFRQWQQGDESLAETKATAHLFKDGVAVSSWSSTATSSPTAEARPSKRRKTTATSATDTDKTKARPAIIPPHCQPFRPVFQPGRTIFLANENGKFGSAAGIAKTCEKALLATRGRHVDAELEDPRLIDRNLFVLRWRDVKTARMFEGTSVRVNNIRPRAQAYPTAPPQIFAAHLNHHGDHSIRTDAVLPAIRTAVADNPVHLRHEAIGSSSNTVWLAVFKRPPQMLRFTVGIQDKNGRHQVVAWEPLMPKAACPLCQQAHSAVDCELLGRAKKAELGVKKGDESYLAKMPELE